MYESRPPLNMEQHADIHASRAVFLAGTNREPKCQLRLTLLYVQTCIVYVQNWNSKSSLPQKCHVICWHVLKDTMRGSTLRLAVCASADVLGPGSWCVVERTEVWHKQLARGIPSLGNNATANPLDDHSYTPPYISPIYHYYFPH